MEEWSEIRRRVLVEGLSKRAACRAYGLHWHTLTKMLEHSEPPGCRAAQPRARRRIGPFPELIAEILKQDQTAPRKQRHAKQRILNRLKAEHGYTGGYTAVKEVVRGWERRHRFYRVTKLITRLVEARQERKLGRFKKQLARHDRLVLDELSYVPASELGAELLFDVISTAYERTSLLVTTNLPFEN